MIATALRAAEIAKHHYVRGNRWIFPADRAYGVVERTAKKLKNKKTTPSQGHLGRVELLAEIEYLAKSAEGKVRHPFFRGLREDL